MDNVTSLLQLFLCCIFVLLIFFRELGKLEVLKGGLFSLLLFAAGSNPIYYAVNGGVGRLPKIVEIALLLVVVLPILL